MRRLRVATPTTCDDLTAASRHPLGPTVPTPTHDLRRLIREVPTWVVVALLPPGNDLSRPVPRSAPVGVEEASQKVARMLFDDGPLPWLHPQDSFVLASRTMLGKQARPVHPQRLDNDDARTSDAIGPALRMHGSGQILDIVDDGWIARIAGNPKHIASSGPAQRAITEVKPEKTRVCLTIEVTTVACRATRRTDTLCVPPLPQCRPADACVAAQPRKAHAVVHLVKRSHTRPLAVHVISLKYGSDTASTRERGWVSRVGFEPTLDRF